MAEGFGALHGAHVLISSLERVPVSQVGFYRFRRLRSLPASREIFRRYTKFDQKDIDTQANQAV
jgi:hypothetical protein